MNRVWEVVAALVVGFVWDVLDRGGKWARESHVPLTGDDDA